MNADTYKDLRRNKRMNSGQKSGVTVRAAKKRAGWALPPLSTIPKVSQIDDKMKKTILSALAEFGIDAKVARLKQGPVVTRFELLPAAGADASRICELSANLTLALKTESIRIQAPMPGKRLVGVEVPNCITAPVVLRQVLESSAWKRSKAALPLALGQDVGGQVLIADLASLPHMLIAGATGQGKTVGMKSILAGLLMTRTPDELRLILIDLNADAFAGYNDLPHLWMPVIADPRKAISSLQWAIEEMERRFKMFRQAKVRNIRAYNGRSSQAPRHESETITVPLPDRLPYVVIIIKELADLMLNSQKEIEPRIKKLTRLAHTAGIHMVIATQRPTANVLTSAIKSNIPGRVALKVSQKKDSLAIIDQDGADTLLGKGDMLVLTCANNLMRAQGALTKDMEIQAVVDHWKRQVKAQQR